MKLEEYIGHRIRKQRLEAGMTQEELANRLKTTKQSISRYENGKRNIDQDVLFELSEIFRVNIDEFFPKKSNDVVPVPANADKGWFYVKVRDDSMDKEFPVGSLALIDPTIRPENGELAAVRVEDGVELKEVHRSYEDDKLVLVPRSNNREYFPTVYDLREQDVFVLGKIIGVFIEK